MRSSTALRIRLALTALCVLVPLIAPAAAQSASTPPEAPVADTDRNSPPYTMAIEGHAVIRADLTGTTDTTVRFKVLRESAIRTLGQQSLSYVESLNPLEVVEAHTEKADGRQIPVEPGTILTRDAATGLNAVYQRDAKVKTLIFPDIEVGDTLVYVTRTNRIDKRFPGHFIFRALFPRSAAYETYQLTVDAPRSLGLRVHVEGDGLSHETSAAGAEDRHVFRYRPRIWTAEEPGAVSSWDRDPHFEITTFKDMSQLGASYWSSMQGDDAIAPEIRALAEEITKGIDDRRGQVVAIDRWVKRNIRYVLVFLGSGGITPNPAASVLKNKFGDCKDHVALMGALLRAKGIASEQVLISVGNMYRLPDLPVPSFNHVMLYLPEFDAYTDPTASHAAFGILPTGSYDKPVLHITSGGSRLARTPPMRPEDHVSTTTTTASVGADGVIKGTTRQTATGVFATSARGTALQIQAQGREKYAETLLRNLGRPGTGVFEPAAPFDFTEPYNVSGEFSVSQKLQLPLSGARDIPIGMPIHRRPGVGLLGQRLAGRTTDFPCYAGKQIEEIELTFAEGLALPKPIKDGAINNKYFSYQFTYTIKGRTLTIRREFTSKVPRQVCGKEIEAEIATPLDRVARNLRVQMSF
jgi:transglutaminase-like putative cysteine protease